MAPKETASFISDGSDKNFPAHGARFVHAVGNGRIGAEVVDNRRADVVFYVRQGQHQKVLRPGETGRSIRLIPIGEGGTTRIAGIRF
jgi:hypothetical protein